MYWSGKYPCERTTGEQAPNDTDKIAAESSRRDAGNLGLQFILGFLNGRAHGMPPVNWAGFVDLNCLVWKFKGLIATDIDYSGQGACSI